MREQELIVYRKLTDGKILNDMAWLMDHYEDDFYNRADKAALLYDCIHDLIELAGHYDFYGNLWHCYLTHLLVNHENNYSTGCEIRGAVSGTINQAVLHDMSIFKEFFDYDFTNLAERLAVNSLTLLEDYVSRGGESKVYNVRICLRLGELAKQLGKSHGPDHMKEILTHFYKEYGVGKFGLHKAFRVVHNEEGVLMVPILNIAHVKLNDLVGYEIPKKKLVENTEAFVAGRKSNNCLLYGDAGTGKSTCIKAIANAYYGKGLRIIEIYKHQFRDLYEIIRQVKNRNYKFIIYMDDLSFEDFETEYKYLKAIIEGGLERKPENVLIYATSNRRHLIRENYSDKEAVREDMHASDTVQEKLSLAARFGVSIYFGSPDKNEFHNIVYELARREGILMEKELLLAGADQWELAHGGLSGRCAQQFIDYLLGKEDPV